MPSTLPEGDDAPADGLLPLSAARGATERAFGVYVHVPYCRVRCGYCDFNTYTATELGADASQAHYASQAAAEIRFAGEVLRASDVPSRKAATVFFGGGTPTLLPSSDLALMLNEIREVWGVAEGAEITTEANPETVDPVYLRELADAGFTRVSIGMQSAVPQVLHTLDRTHRPERVPQVVQWARDAGVQVSVDLIFGTPGESLHDFQVSLEAAIAMQPDHISAYALIVEPGTKLHRMVARGDIQAPDEDTQAEMYELADTMLTAAGFNWYEISNWSRSASTRSAHNLSYWQGADWWGVGPGAHSHVGGVRWWNVKHPRAYAERIAAGLSPAYARETLSTETRRIERVLLETRIDSGLPLSVLTDAERPVVAELIAEGLIDGRAALGVNGEAPRIVPTLSGRLLADTVVHRLLASSSR